jgi:hypothetical protein
MFSIHLLIRILAVGLLFVLALAIFACGDSEDEAGVSAQCQAFDEFASYRYSISVKMQLPGTPALGTYADNLASLLSA